MLKDLTVRTAEELASKQQEVDEMRAQLVALREQTARDAHKTTFATLSPQVGRPRYVSERVVSRQIWRIYQRWCHRCYHR